MIKYLLPFLLLVTPAFACTPPAVAVDDDMKTIAARPSIADEDLKVIDNAKVVVGLADALGRTPDMTVPDTLVILSNKEGGHLIAFYAKGCRTTAVIPLDDDGLKQALLKAENGAL